MYYVILSSFPQNNGGIQKGYLIQSDKSEYPYYINKFLHHKALGSSNTAKQYAYRTCRYLNYLNRVNKNYLKADEKTIENYLLHLVYGDENEVILEGKITTGTIQANLTVLRQLYAYLFDQGVNLNLNIQRAVGNPNQKSFFYGSIWSKSFISVIPHFLVESTKPGRIYEKWYTEEQIEAIFNSFKSIRDQAVFSLSLDGLRIDEILSLKIMSIDQEAKTCSIPRSKGKHGSLEARKAVLSERSLKLIEDYLFNERDLIEAELLSEGKALDQSLFINLKKTPSRGAPLSYRNYIEILKSAAKRAGLDPETIRTHSGRSTKAQELFRIQDENPGLLTDYQICELMGWVSLDSSRPYKNSQDRITALANIKKLTGKDNNE